MSTRRNYINIDKTKEVAKRFTLKRTLLIMGLTIGIGGASVAIGNSMSDATNNNTAIEQNDYSKVFKSFQIQPGDTLTSIANRIMDEYPDTAYFYTKESLIKEVAKINGLGTNVDDIKSGEYIIVPYYMPNVVLTEETVDVGIDENVQESDDYQDYVVEFGDSYWKIASKYTNDDNELIRIMNEIQLLNKEDILRAGAVIKIPSIEKYQLLHSTYEEPMTK